MLLTVSEFHDRVSNQLDKLVSDLQDNTGRCGPEEATAWRNSLPAISMAFCDQSFSNLHLYFGGDGCLSIEYRLPSSSSWCDMVLLGSHNGRPSGVIVELKDWTTRNDKPGDVEGLMLRHTGTTLHPSDQVRGYTEYCRRFHSAVIENKAHMNGCVVFTKDFLCKAYSDPPNHELVQDYPYFTLSELDVREKIPNFFADKLTDQDLNFAIAFEKGHYKQDRNFCKQIASQIMDPITSPFELLDGQRKAYSLCKATIDSKVFPTLLLGRAPGKIVIIVDGPPGSGKSIVAAKIWATLLTDNRLPKGNVVFTTTSVSQNSNWIALFQKAAGQKGGGGVVIKANEHIPITTQEVGKIRKRYGDVFKDPPEWQENLELIKQYRKEGYRIEDNAFLVSVVDEAHALINPEHSDARGQFGFAVLAGPQAYHIIRSSVVTMFFLDSKQSFRERETTTVDDIKRWAGELGAEIVEEISLAGNQFRCAGSKEYVDWIESVLEEKPLRQIQEAAGQWVHLSHSEPFENHRQSKKKQLVFHIVDVPSQLDESLSSHIVEGHSVRLLASYAREWKTKGLNTPHDLPDMQKDFYETYFEDGLRKNWARIWNFVPKGNDYTGFIQARQGTPMFENQLSEVGCPYAVRGFDFDYVGILWLGDLKWRSKQWIISVDQIYESGLMNHISRAKKELDSNGPAHEELKQKIIQGYRILLTRAMKGVYLWFEDDQTKDYIKSCLQSEKLRGATGDENRLDNFINNFFNNE